MSAKFLCRYFQPLQAQHVHVVPGLASMSLLAMGPLCDAGCTIEFNAYTVHVWLQEQVVLEGRRDLPVGLWVFQLPTPAVPTNQKYHCASSQFSHWCSKGSEIGCLLSCYFVLASSFYLGKGASMWLCVQFSRSDCQDATMPSALFHCYSKGTPRSSLTRSLFNTCCT